MCVIKRDEVQANMNYFSDDGLFSRRYIYVDLNVDSGYAADSLFYKRKIPVKFKNEMFREGDKYRLIFCKIPKRFRQAFEEALEELKTKMCLLGHNDYEDYCDNLMKELEEMKTGESQ